MRDRLMKMKEGKSAEKANSISKDLATKRSLQTRTLRFCQTAGLAPQRATLSLITDTPSIFYNLQSTERPPLPNQAHAASLAKAI